MLWRLCAGAGAGVAAAANALRILSACVSGGGAGASSLLYSCASASRALFEEFRYRRCVEGAFEVASCRVAQKMQTSRVEETCQVSKFTGSLMRGVLTLRPCARRMMAMVQFNGCCCRELSSKVLLDFHDILRKSTGILPVSTRTSATTTHKQADAPQHALV